MATVQKEVKFCDNGEGNMLWGSVADFWVGGWTEPVKEWHLIFDINIVHGAGASPPDPLSWVQLWG